MGQDERLARARAVLRRAEDDRPLRATDGSYPVPPVLAGLLPHGVRRGSVGVVRGSTSLLLSVLGEMSRHRAWIAVVGMPGLGLDAACQQGVDLARVVVVPRPQERSATVVAALVDGMDVVVCGDGVALTAAQQRRIAGRARERRSVVLSVRPWAGAAVELAVPQQRWTGLEPGYGRLRDLRVVVERRDQGAGRRLEVEPWARRAG